MTKFTILKIIIILLIAGGIGFYLASLEDLPQRGEVLPPRPEKVLYDVKASRNEAKSKLDNMIQTKDKLIKDKEKAISEFDEQIKNSETNIKTLEKELQDKENILQEELKK
jgi:uncharacterized protein (DUF3084 family)